MLCFSHPVNQILGFMWQEKDNWIFHIAADKAPDKHAKHDPQIMAGTPEDWELQGWIISENSCPLLTNPCGQCDNPCWNDYLCDDCRESNVHME